MRESFKVERKLSILDQFKFQKECDSSENEENNDLGNNSK